VKVAAAGCKATVVGTAVAVALVNASGVARGCTLNRRGGGTALPPGSERVVEVEQAGARCRGVPRGCF
jgi:hypothetical protein